MTLGAENYSLFYLFIYCFIILYYNTIIIILYYNTIIIILYYNTIPHSLYHETLKKHHRGIHKP